MKPLYEIKTYKQYERDVKRAIRQGLDIGNCLMSLGSCVKASPYLLNSATIC